MLAKECKKPRQAYMCVTVRQKKMHLHLNNILTSPSPTEIYKNERFEKTLI